MVGRVDDRWSPRRQGDFGELSAASWLASRGASLFIPFGHSPHVDLVADFGDRLVRVQVKTTGCVRRARWEATLCTRGGNQSWNGRVKYLDARQCDMLFVHVGDGRRWYIPVAVVAGLSGIVLGGSKYSEFEVAPGDPLPGRFRREPLPGG
jgi:PD-(D/E)XK endonuclease